MHFTHGWHEAFTLFCFCVLAYIPINKQGRRKGLRSADGSRKEIAMNITRSFNNWRKYRQTVSELGRMTTRELHDLGIDRSDIARVAREATGGTR
jgi:uncharacterized protein YjiS (DUF1127 family)